MHLFLLRLSFIYLLFGMLLGVAMGATSDFTLRPVHAHLNLLGWAVPAVAGLMVAACPGLERERLFRAFCWVYNLAMPASLVSLAVMLGAIRDAGAVSPLAAAMKALAIGGSIGLVASIVMLLTALWRQPRTA